jgi:hypothetical protein
MGCHPPVKLEQRTLQGLYFMSLGSLHFILQISTAYQRNHNLLNVKSITPWMKDILTNCISHLGNDETRKNHEFIQGKTIERRSLQLPPF